MILSAINFFSEEIDFVLEEPSIIAKWVKTIASNHSVLIVQLNYVFTSDEYLRRINKKHLGHDYFTDIITFDQSDIVGKIEGDVFISIERVSDNAKEMGTDPFSELLRVIAHGLLHLIGYKDKTRSERLEMRTKEDECLRLYANA